MPTLNSALKVLVGQSFSFLNGKVRRDSCCPNQTSEISQMKGFLDVSVSSVAESKRGVIWLNVRMYTWTELVELNSPL